jgi:hypothetical protein
MLRPVINVVPQFCQLFSVNWQMPFTAGCERVLCAWRLVWRGQENLPGRERREQKRVIRIHRFGQAAGISGRHADEFSAAQLGIGYAGHTFLQPVTGGHEPQRLFWQLSCC